MFFGPSLIARLGPAREVCLFVCGISHTHQSLYDSHAYIWAGRCWPRAEGVPSDRWGYGWEPCVMWTISLLGVEAKNRVYMNGRCVWVGVGELGVGYVHVVDLVRSLCIRQEVMVRNLMWCGL